MPAPQDYMLMKEILGPRNCDGSAEFQRPGTHLDTSHGETSVHLLYVFHDQTKNIDVDPLQAMFDILEADIVVLQETKIQRKDLSDDMVLVPGWDCYFSLPKHKKGKLLCY